MGDLQDFDLRVVEVWGGREGVCNWIIHLAVRRENSSFEGRWTPHETPWLVTCSAATSRQHNIIQTELHNNTS